MTHHIVPLPLRAARLAAGVRVIDIRGMFGMLAGAPAGSGQAIARTAVVPEAATRIVTLGC
jgi:hypothetical protein